MRPPGPAQQRHGGTEARPEQAVAGSIERDQSDGRDQPVDHGEPNGSHRHARGGGDEGKADAHTVEQHPGQWREEHHGRPAASSTAVTAHGEWVCW